MQPSLAPLRIALQRIVPRWNLVSGLAAAAEARPPPPQTPARDTFGASGGNLGNLFNVDWDFWGWSWIAAGSGPQQAPPLHLLLYLVLALGVAGFVVTSVLRWVRRLLPPPPPPPPPSSQRGFAPHVWLARIMSSSSPSASARRLFRNNTTPQKRNPTVDGGSESTKTSKSVHWGEDSQEEVILDEQEERAEEIERKNREEESKDHELQERVDRVRERLLAMIGEKRAREESGGFPFFFSYSLEIRS